MKKKFLGFTLLCALLVASCSQEEAHDYASQGEISVEVKADSRLAQTRTVAVAVPDPKEFSMNIVSPKNETIVQVDKLSEYVPVKVPVGVYTVNAFYGKADAEGFDALSFSGTSSVQVVKNGVAQAQVSCTINKALVTIDYTEAFKKYFSSYSAYVATSQGGKITYVANETRPSYVVPGKVGVFLKVTKTGSNQSVELNPKNLTAEARHEYHLTMDVDASSATLNVIFNDQPAHVQNVTIDVSDEALNAPAPLLKAQGFVSGQTLEFVEGLLPATANGDRYAAYLNAQGGIGAVTLSAVSPWWTSKNYPAEQNLVEVNKPYWNGLELVGLSDKRDKIAGIDFTSMLSYLACTNREADFEEHTFTLKATDLLTKVSEPIVLKVKTLNDRLAVAKISEPTTGTTQVKVAVTMNGATQEDMASKVKFAYKTAGAFIPVFAKHISVEAGAAPNTWQVTLTLPELMEGPLEVKVTSPARNEQVLTYDVQSVIALSQPNGAGDVWAHTADVQLKPVGTLIPSISSDQVSFQYKKGNDWSPLTHTYAAAGDVYTLTGLTAGTAYEVRAVYVHEGVNQYSSSVSFTTEKESQVANSSFENWTQAPRVSKHWELYYVEDGWGTMNEVTTSEGGNSGGLNRNAYRYNANSGTIPSEGDAKSGTKAALIRAVGWGAGNSAWGTANAKYGTVGELYLGHCDKASKQAVYEGTAFESRPLSMSFWHKYRPGKGGDQLWAEVQVLHREGATETVLGKGLLRQATEVSAWTELTVPITYTDKTKKATHLRIIFKSGEKSDNASFVEVPNFGNLSTGEYVGSKLWVDDVKLNFTVK